MKQWLLLYSKTHIWNTGSESSMSYLSHSGANVPGNESSWERKFQGAKVPGSESSTYGTFALESESTWERKFQLPWRTLRLYQWQLTVYLGGPGKIRPAKVQCLVSWYQYLRGKQPNSFKQGPAGDYRGTALKHTSTAWLPSGQWPDGRSYRQQTEAGRVCRFLPHPQLVM